LVWFHVILQTQRSHQPDIHKQPCESWQG
jgi:hypothetical protein